MNVGIIVDNELNNDKRVLREIGILKEKGYRIFVLCFGFERQSYGTIEGVLVNRIRIRKRLKNILFFFMNIIPLYEMLWSAAIKRFITANTPDILHVHDLYMARAGKSGIEKSGRRIPMILDLHENYPYAVTTYNWTRGLFRNLIARPSVWRKKEKKYLEYADRIIVLSEEFRDSLTGQYRGLSAKRITVLPNVPDLHQAIPPVRKSVNLEIREGQTVLFYFGVVAERRGIFDTLDVFEQLVRENHPSILLIIGPVDKHDRQRFFSIINSTLLNSRIHYLPWIDLHELPIWLEAADICLAPFQKNPQHESGVANKIYDYMLGRKPVIASDCRPQRKLIEEYNCGIIFRDKREFKSAIEQLTARPELRREMGENGYNAIIKEHNMNLKKTGLVSLYEEISSKGQT